MNAGEEEADISFSTEYGEIKEAKGVRLEGPDLYAYNTIEEPEKVTTKEMVLSGEDCKTLRLPKESFTVYRFTVK